MIGHDQDLAVRAKHAGQPLAFGRVEGQAGIVVVVGDRVEKRDLGLAERRDARLGEAGQRGGERHVGVQRAGVLRNEAVDRRVNAEGRALDLAFARSTAPS